MENAVLSKAAVYRARLLLIGATILWGLSFPLLRGLELVQRAYVPHVPASALACADTAMRFGVAGLFLLPIFGRQLRRVTKREWSQAIGLATFAGAGLYLQTLGLAWTDASVSAFLTQLYTLLVPLIVAFRDQRFPTSRVMMACVLVLFGVALLSPGLFMHLRFGSGEVVILASTGFLAGQIVWVERTIYAENRSGVVTLIMFALLTLMFLLGYVGSGGVPGDVGALFGTSALLELTVPLVLLCTVFNFFIMNTWQRCVTATEAGLIYCIEPVVATALCAFLPGWISTLAGISYPNEVLTWTLFAGGGLIVAATILVATEKPV